MSQPGSHHNCDIAIVGGGMVGSLLALTLAAQQQRLQQAGCQPWRITVLERSASSPQKPSADAPLAGRTTALSASTCQHLEQLGLWGNLQAQCAAISTIHVSERGSCGLTHLRTAENQLEAFGYVVENALLLAELRAAISAAAIDWRAPAQVEQMVAGGEQQRLILGDGEIAASLVVSAEGANSALLAGLGIRSERTDYQQQAIIANLALAQPHNGVAYERFDRAGPMALLPLTSQQGLHRTALVWTHAEGDEQRWIEASDAEFCREIERLFGERIGGVTAVGERRAFGLALQRSSEQVRRGLVVLGNAAHALHPVAGQGFNLSVRDVAALAEELLRARLAGDSPSELSTLQRYQQRQQSDQQQTILFSDLLPKLFSSRLPGVAALRRSGLAAMDLLPPLRQRFAQFGMGSDRGAEQ